MGLARVFSVRMDDKDSWEPETQGGVTLEEPAIPGERGVENERLNLALKIYPILEYNS